MTELEALRERHSVRSYQNKKIEEETVRELCRVIDEVNAETGLSFQFIADAGKTFNRLLNKFMGLGSAPSVIACVGKDDGELDYKVGYYGEKIVLAAQMLGLNTCFAGTYNKDNVSAKIGEGERLAIVIAVGYGTDGGKARRSKKPQDVADGIDGAPAWFVHGVEAALLAPTAINQQRFKITLGDDGKPQFSDLGGVLSKIDLGIVKYNFEVGAREG